MTLNSFPIILTINTKALILGTILSTRSLILNQYYRHNRNAFWKLIFTIFDKPFSSAYETRKNILLKNKVAVWDVLSTCTRIGSLDSAIEQEVHNDFNTFLAAHSNIEYIFFNGQKAAQYFKKYVTVSEKHKLYNLPSTSPANAGMSFEQKLVAWQMIRQCM
ncbi:DNA-deoxyinosine glycosylase [Flavobacterium sp.]|uniref:DNA-deoxyinosine glycosylase n=1 Tax=Flavobacterium sp. TaxID=239 RepID=UPI0037506A61